MKRIETAARNGTKLALMSASLVLLTGCEWGKKNEQTPTSKENTITSGCTIIDDPLVEQGEILVSMDGKPVVSVKSFERHFNKLLEDNPQYKEFLARSPEAKKNALNGLAGQAAIDEDICRRGIDQTAEYQEELKWLIQAQKRMLNLKYFTDSMDVKVSDAEVKESYEKNKDIMPQLLVSQGGVKAMGIPFDTQADAQAFKEKLGNKNLDEQAKANGLTDKMRDFKLVNANSFGIDPLVRDAVMGLKANGSTLVQGKDGKYWVVQASSVEEKQYRPFNEVKEALRSFAEREKGIKLFEQELERLKKQYTIVVNDAYFGAPSATDQEALMQELEQMINQESDESGQGQAAQVA